MDRSIYYKMEYDDKVLEKLDTVLRESVIGPITDEDVEEFIGDKELFSAKSILFSTSGLTEQSEIDAKKALAQDVLRRIKNGEDFDKLMFQYSEDPGVTSDPNGYVFAEGEFVTSYFDAVKEMEIGDISDLVEDSTYGYFIIQRIAIIVTLYGENVYQDRYDKELTTRVNSADVKYAAGYNNISIAYVEWEILEEDEDETIDESVLPGISEEEQENLDTLDDGTDTAGGETEDTESAA